MSLLKLMLAIMLVAWVAVIAFILGIYLVATNKPRKK